MSRGNLFQDKDQDILIEGMRNRNRALERDEVAVKLNPESEWKVRVHLFVGFNLCTLP
jgi:hypothetical protein